MRRSRGFGAGTSMKKVWTGRGMTLLSSTKVRLLKALHVVWQVAAYMYGCESWTIKGADDNWNIFDERVDTNIKSHRLLPRGMSFRASCCYQKHFGFNKLQ